MAALSQRFFAPLGPLEVEAKATEAAVIFARDVGIQNIIFEEIICKSTTVYMEPPKPLLPLLMFLMAFCSTFNLFILLIFHILGGKETSLPIF